MHRTAQSRAADGVKAADENVKRTAAARLAMHWDPAGAQEHASVRVEHCCAAAGVAFGRQPGRCTSSAPCPYLGASAEVGPVPDVEAGSGPAGTDEGGGARGRVHALGRGHTRHFHIATGALASADAGTCKSPALVRSNRELWRL